MKKIFTFALTLVMVLSLSITAFATDNGSITITNAKIGQTYTVYKIFNANLNADASGITYSISPDNQFFVEMFGADGKKDNPCFTYIGTTGAVTKKDGVNDDVLFEYLESLIDENVQPAKDPITATGTTVNFTGLEYGYYLITSTLGATVTIDSTNPHADVIDKNQTTITPDKKIKASGDENWTDENTVNVGDTVEFKVEFTALNYKGDKKVDKYTLEDTLDPLGWAAIDPNSIQIKVGSKVLTKGTDWTLVNGDANGFKIDIPWQDADGNFLYAPSVNVEVTYSATVLEAAADENPTEKKNTVSLTWDNTTSSDETKTNLYNMGFTKIDGKDSTKTLANAKFKLYSDPDCTEPVNVSGSNGVYTVGGTSNEVVTPDDGQVIIMGLKAGTYYLKETVPPAGYNLMNETKTVNVGIEDTGDTMTIGETTYTLNNAELNIENNKGVELPSTGGKGTMMMITLGSIVALAFAVLLITHKKMSVYHD